MNFIMTEMCQICNFSIIKRIDHEHSSEVARQAKSLPTVNMGYNQTPLPPSTLLQRVWQVDPCDLFWDWILGQGVRVEFEFGRVVERGPLATQEYFER